MNISNPLTPKKRAEIANQSFRHFVEMCKESIKVLKFKNYEIIFLDVNVQFTTSAMDNATVTIELKTSVPVKMEESRFFILTGTKDSMEQMFELIDSWMNQLHKKSPQYFKEKTLFD